MLISMACLYKEMIYVCGCCFSQAVVVDKTVYLSGQIAMDPATGAIIPGGVAAETHQVRTH